MQCGDHRSMLNFFYPKSITIVGLSATKADLCKPIIDNLVKHGFKGQLTLVGRRGGTFKDMPIYQSIEEIPKKTDLAVLLITSSAIPAAIEACGRKGIHNIIIEAGGFTESSEAHRDLEKEILQAAHKWKMRILGPNCIGIVNMNNAMVLPFHPLNLLAMKKGSVSIISQSGGIIINCLKLLDAENIGVNKIISIGNKLDLTENDFVDYLISDSETKILALYLENISDGRALVELAAQTDKPIIILKSNIGKASRNIAQFHTTALTGDDRVADAAFRQSGIHRVQSVLELVNQLKVFALPLMRGPRLAVLCRSGGHAVLCADAAERYGFELAPLPQRLIRMVKEASRSGVIKLTTPLDLGDIFNFNCYISIMEEALKHNRVDGLLFAHVISPEDMASTKDIILSAKSLSEKYQKPVLVSFVCDPDQYLSIKGTVDFPFFTEPDEALKALASSRLHFRRLTAWNRKKGSKLTGTTRKQVQIKSSHLYTAPLIQVFSMLKDYGIPVADHAIVTNVRKALHEARRIGYPVALKTASSAVIHKTEAGEVLLNIPNEAMLKRSFQTRIGKEYIIQKMATCGWELILGAKQDPEFGPIVLCGMGGIFVEILQDTIIRLAPVDRRTVEGMIAEMRGNAILQGFRGQPQSDIGALTSCIIGLSRLIAKCHHVWTVEINPLILRERGQGCVAVDAKMEILETRHGQYLSVECQDNVDNF